MGISYAIEGNEGAGKSLLYSLTREMLRKATILPVLGVREPGGTPLGEKIIRPVLRDPEYQGMHSITNTLLYTASRAELYFNREIPFLENNPKGILLKDRSWLSTIALQSIDGASLEYIKAVNKPFMGIPDKFIIIDIPVEETVSRMFAEYSDENNNREPDWKDKQDIQILSAIRANYLRFATQHRDRCVVLDTFEEPWKNAARIGLDAIVELRKKENVFLGDVECRAIFDEFESTSKQIVDTEEIHVFVPEDRYVKVYDIERYRKNFDKARKELGYPSAEELRQKMHLEWQAMGLEGVSSFRERRV